MNNPFASEIAKSETIDGLYDDSERILANRNSGTLLETLSLDITPIVPITSNILTPQL